MSRRLVMAVLTLCLAAAGLTAPAGAAGLPAAAPPTLPAPTYQSISQEVLVTMDDGVRLAATVAFPSKDGASPASGRFPVVLSMTPYGRNGVCGCISPAFFATRGMVAAVVDVRGTGGSEGDLEGNFFSPREARDGYLLVEHFGTQSYSSGKVGMAGASYVGITQYLTAEQQPPHLAVIVPQVAISDLYRDGFAHGGIENLSFDLQYIAVQGAPGTAGTNTSPYLLEESLKAKLGQSPPGTIAFDYLERPNDDTFYRNRSPIYHADRIQVPVLDIGSWNDGLLRGETEMYTRSRQAQGRRDPAVHGPLHPQGMRSAVRAADQPTGPVRPRRDHLRVPRQVPHGREDPRAVQRRVLPPGEEHLPDLHDLAAGGDGARPGWPSSLARWCPTASQAW